MTWLAVSDHDERRLSLNGLGHERQPLPILRDAPDTLLTRGTLMFETHPVVDDDRPEQLFGYAASTPWARSLMFSSLPGGGIALSQTHGARRNRVEVRMSEVVRRDVLRVSYSWDSTARWGRLSMEQPEETHVASVEVHSPVPLTLIDIRNLMLGGRGAVFSPDMIFAALSDAIEPVGPTPTLLPQTPVATPWGFRTVESLQRGDTVTTHASGVVPVVHALSRTVPARGSFAPVRIRAPYFGLVDDIIVSPEQRLLIDGPEVEYLFGREAVLVPARHLVNGFNALAEPCAATVTYGQLLLPKHETLIAAGTELESLYVGRIRRNAAHLAGSVLAGLDRAGLPEHGRPSHQVLRQFEAIHLAKRRAA